MSRTVYVNGEFVAEENAQISVFDRGFLFADAVYEVSSVIDGKLLDNDRHLARLHRSLNELKIPAPDSDENIVRVQRELIERNGLTEGSVYLQVTRGVADRDFAFPPDAVPGIVMFTQTKQLRESPQANNGISIVTLPDIRWKRRDIKTVGLLAQAMAKQAALDAGATDAWMVEDGFVTEGSSNNAFIVDKNDCLVTRQLGNDILHGITRASVLKLTQTENIKLEERPFTVAEALEAKEAFITSATTFVWPVISIDGHTIADGKPGAVARRLRELYIETALQAAT